MVAWKSLPVLAAGVILSGLGGLAAAQDSPGPEFFNELDRNDDGKLVADEMSESQARFFERILRIGDADEDGAITPDELKSALAAQREEIGSGEERRGGRRAGPFPGGPEFLRQLDRNKDGKLSRDELPPPLQRRMEPLFERLGTEEIDLNQLRQLADRGDGERGPRDGDRPEGDRPRGRPDEAGRGPGGPPDGRGRDGDRRPPHPPEPPPLMRVLDEDQNGRISKAEMLSVGRLFAELDRNHDGELDGPELMGHPPGPGHDGPRGPGMDRPHPPGPPDDRPGDRGPRSEDRGRPGDRTEGRDFRSGGASAFFDRLDKNEDGELSREEAPGRMAERFEQLDTDGDGMISKEEFRGMFDRRRGDRPRPEGRPDSERDND